MEENKIFIPKEELVLHGCKNCVWRLHKQCPYGFEKDTEFYVPDRDSKLPKSELKNQITGICPEFTDFIFSMAEGADSISAVWEKFNLYILRLQGLEDYKGFKKSQEKLALAQAEGSLSVDQMKELEMERNGHKIWWSRLNEQVLKGLARVVDREKRVETGAVQKLSVQQLNVLIHDSAMKKLDVKKEGDK